jgi:integral membrane protein
MRQLYRDPGFLQAGKPVAKMTRVPGFACLQSASIRVFVGRQHDMMGSYKTLVGRVRLVGAIEGISFLLLLGVAMPLKYYANMPKAVSIVGMAHGVLFVGFCLVLLQAWLSEHLSFRWATIAFIATLIPFGPFVIDKKLQNFDKP